MVVVEEAVDVEVEGSEREAQMELGLVIWSEGRRAHLFDFEQLATDRAEVAAGPSDFAVRAKLEDDSGWLSRTHLRQAVLLLS